MITTTELKKKYLEFFRKQGHSVIASASLIPENDPTVLFTTAGMRPLVPYLLGEQHPAGRRLADVQKCIRTADIDDVGDNSHLTFFEMLGNWSLGDYFKKEAIEWSFEFLTQVLKIPLEKLAVSCFKGEPKNNIPKDEESARIWQSLGVPKGRIAFMDREEDWWGPAGQTGPCGPDTEMYYWTGKGAAPKKFDPGDKQWMEFWNDVFMQYNKTADGRYEELKQKNVDTGMGVERTTAMLNGQDNVYATDAFEPLLTAIAKLATKPDVRSTRIIADHLRAATFILGDEQGIAPSNLDRGYVLRRLIRRAIRHGKLIGITKPFTHVIAEAVIKLMHTEYPELQKNKDFIIEQLVQEEERFGETLENGLKEFENILKRKKKKIPPFSIPMASPGSATTDLTPRMEKYKDWDKKITGEEAFILFSTFGFPLEMTDELAKERGIAVDKKMFESEFTKHQALSRTATAGRFKGGLADHSEATTRLHTATHLLLAALRTVLGDHVFQRGSNITADRLRLDFSHPDKLTDAERQRVEEIVNEQIERNLPVSWQEMSLDEARTLSAMGVFESKYSQRVKVYTIGDPAKPFSREICGGPHVEAIGSLSHFRLTKEEASSAGVRRIKAILD